MHPDIYQVELIGSGYLAVMAKPASDWLAEDIAGLAQLGIKRVVSLLETHEEYELGLQNEAVICAKQRIEFVSYPIQDRGLPRSVASFTELTKAIYHQSAAGNSTVVHCRAGIGRSGLVAAGVLLHCGFEVPEAFARVSKARRVKVPDTEQQEFWLREHASVIVNSSRMC